MIEVVALEGHLLPLFDAFDDLLDAAFDQLVLGSLLDRLQHLLRQLLISERVGDR